MKITEEIEEELTRIIKWIADQGYTVSESKEFLSLAQSIIEESAPVKEVNIKGMFDNYLPSSSSLMD